MKLLKLLSIYILFLLFVSISNGQYIRINTGQQFLKMFCQYTRTIEYNKESNPETPAGAILYMDFDPSQINFSPTNFVFSSLFPAGGIAPVFVDGIAGVNSRLAAQRGGIDNILPSNGNIGSITFSSKRVLSTSFSFYTSGRVGTDDLSETDLYYGNGFDMLLAVYGATYYFNTGLCNDDIVGPTIGNFDPNITASTRQVGYGTNTLGPVRNVSPKIYSASGLKFDIRDGDNYTKNQPGYVSGTYPNLNINDYRANTAGPTTYSPLNVADRASGINPGPLTFNLSNTPITFNYTNVTVLSGVGYTWDRRFRDYHVEIDGSNINDYGIEGNITFNAHLVEFSAKTADYSYTFNQIVAPWITDLNPVNGQNQVLPLSDYFLRVRDDWAGVDSGTLVVRFYHSGSLIGEFSGSDLNLNPVIGDANTPDFNIHIVSGATYNGKRFVLPINTGINIANTIQVVLSLRDNKGNITSSPYDRYSFDTRYSCASYSGCSDMLTIYSYNNGSPVFWDYYDTILYVTGAQQIGYPIVDTGNQLIDCGTGVVFEYTGINLTGEYLNNPGLYTGDVLYFSGGTVTINGNVVTIKSF